MRAKSSQRASGLRNTQKQAEALVKKLNPDDKPNVERYATSRLAAAISGDRSDALQAPYPFTVTIGENCSRKMRTFVDLGEKLGMPVEDLMRQCNGKVSPSRALVKGLSRELEIDESYLERLAAELRKDLGGPSASQRCMQCPEYERLWAAYVDASCQWRDILQKPSLRVYVTGLRPACDRTQRRSQGARSRS